MPKGEKIKEKCATDQIERELNFLSFVELQKDSLCKRINSVQSNGLSKLESYCTFLHVKSWQLAKRLIALITCPENIETSCSYL